MARRRRRSRGASGSRSQILILAVLFTAITAGVVILIAVTTGSNENVPSGPISVPDERPADIAQNGHIYGDPDATITVTEYLDFQCPFCARAHFQVMPTIEQRYVETGIAKFEVRTIAILGDESVRAAAAADCAGDQDQFFFYHDTLFLNQGGENVGAFADSRLNEMASAIGLDTAAFDSCLDSDTYDGQVVQDTETARTDGVRSTPTFFVNGQPVETSVEAVSAAIEEAADS